MICSLQYLLPLLIVIQMMANNILVHASPSFSIRLPGKPYTTDWEEVEESSSKLAGRWVSTGREYNIFDSRCRERKQEPQHALSSSHYRGGSSNNDDLSSDDDIDFMERYRRYYKPIYEQNSKKKNRYFQKVQDWWSGSISPKLDTMPKIVCRLEPTTTLKLRKTFRPLKTIVRVGADFNTQLGVWQFKSSWEEPIIGGKLTLIGNELHLTKSWQLYVGAVEELVTRLRFRAAINLQTFQAYARVGFRTERLSPINVMEGFTILKRLPLDGTRGNVKMEVKANVALPEPEIEYSTESQRSLIGMGDVEVTIDEMNLLLDY